MDPTNLRAELLLPGDLCSFDTVSELEEPLDRRLIAAGVGEVIGGGIGAGWYRFDLALADYDAAAARLIEWAADLGLPEGTCLRRAGDDRITVIVAEL